MILKHPVLNICKLTYRLINSIKKLQLADDNEENLKNLHLISKGKEHVYLDWDLVVPVEEGFVPYQQLDKTEKGRKVREDGPFSFFV